MLTFVQYAGDYREAYQCFAKGGHSTYQAQRYSVEFVGDLARRMEVSVVCAITPEPYDTRLPNGVHAIGGGLKEGFDPRALISLIGKPDRLVLRSPMIPLLRWANKNHIRTLATIADSFPGGFARGFRNRLLAYYLNRIEWVANHQLPACRSLASIGVKPEKIIPYDWPPAHRPSDYGQRTLRPGPFKLAYVGMVSEAKGVGDLIHAVRGLPVSLTVIGNGTMDAPPNVRFAGTVPNEDIPTAMREADAVVIPSRHEYPEGLPLTIYEALAARTPIIASDHPMFRGALTHEQSALIFPAGHVAALASMIMRLAEDSSLYARLSANSEKTWNALQLPVTWGELLERWLADDNEWLSRECLSSLVAALERPD